MPGLQIARGLALFCDVTIVSPISRTGVARPSTSNRGGALLEAAEGQNNQTYHEVIASGLGSLQCLGAEVYGRWGQQSVRLVPALAWERARGLHKRIRRGVAMGFQHRWWGLLGVALQSAVARSILQDEGDLPIAPLEGSPCWTELEGI